MRSAFGQRLSEFWGKFTGYHVLQFLLYISTFVRGLVPWITWLYWHTTFKHKKQSTGRSDHIFNFDCLFRQYVDEWSIPASSTADALEEIRAMIAEHNFEVMVPQPPGWHLHFLTSSSPSIQAHFPVEVRFVAPDDIWLSPCYQRQTCYIGVIVYKPYGKDAPYEEYFREYEAIMKRFSGRPHWAKLYEWGVGASYLRTVYPKWDAFLQTRERVDPDRVFVNKYLERILGEERVKSE